MTPTSSQPWAAGADLHIHTAPDIFERCVTAVDAANDAKRLGMRAIVVKSHSTDTAARAEYASQVTGFPVFGGVTLNHAVGGLNPYAVYETVRQGGRIVWMPTIGARHFIENRHLSPMVSKGIIPGVSGIRILGPGDKIKPSVDHILDLVVEHQLTLASGHLSPHETGVLFSEAISRGAKRLIVTHPNAPFIGMSEGDMKALAELGAYLEFTPYGSAETRLDTMRSVGLQQSYVATDGGSLRAGRPAERFVRCLEDLRQAGASDQELRHIAVEVPSYLLNLEGNSEPPQLGARPLGG